MTSSESFIREVITREFPEVPADQIHVSFPDDDWGTWTAGQSGGVWGTKLEWDEDGCLIDRIVVTRDA